jgi:hypothetical protein
MKIKRPVFVPEVQGDDVGFPIIHHREMAQLGAAEDGFDFGQVDYLSVGSAHRNILPEFRSQNPESRIQEKTSD